MAVHDKRAISPGEYVTEMFYSGKKEGIAAYRRKRRTPSSWPLSRLVLTFDFNLLANLQPSNFRVLFFESI